MGVKKSNRRLLGDKIQAGDWRNGSAAETVGLALPFFVPEIAAMATLSLSTSMILRKSGIATRPRAALNQEYKMRVHHELKQGQSRLFHQLPSGWNMEVIFQEGLEHESSDEGKEESQTPPLVFIHGSFHAAWCWAEYWLPYFSQNGYDCYALSLLGQVGALVLIVAV